MLTAAEAVKQVNEDKAVLKIWIVKVDVVKMEVLMLLHVVM